MKCKYFYLVSLSLFLRSNSVSLDDVKLLKSRFKNEDNDTR